MVPLRHSMPSVSSPLSVLALSSRFDGLPFFATARVPDFLSVLALSSRFDGPMPEQVDADGNLLFQYSLCRVVLMVTGH